MDWLLRAALAHVGRGNLRVTSARGVAYAFGDGSGAPIAVRLTSMAAQWAVLLDPDLKLGEAYMDGTFAVERGTIADFVDLVLQQPDEAAWPLWAAPFTALRFARRRTAQLNLRSRARRNVAHHYDLDGRLYSLFLDSDRQYSCAYFEMPNQSLDDAQLAKKRHLAAKLLIGKGHRVLDIGCGWGGLALYAAEFCGAQVTGITLSQEQLALARNRAQERDTLGDLGGRVDFRALDYRDVEETFDRIVSVGMFEHVGVNFYDAFFAKCAEILADDGVMVLHSIGRSNGPTSTSAWIAKYIFPGGYVPALSEVLPAIEHAGLLVTDIEILRLHYAETIKAWRDRFLAHRDEVARLYDARFVRMWEFYLACSETAFRRQNMMVFQRRQAAHADAPCRRVRSQCRDPSAASLLRWVSPPFARSAAMRPPESLGA
jgi:cyclopropane-fatty-acyl-phospholipid synthase